MLSETPPECWNRVKLLADRMCDQELSTEELSELAALLMTNEEVRPWYLAYMRQHAWLEYDPSLASVSPMGYSGVVTSGALADERLAHELGIELFAGPGRAQRLPQKSRRSWSSITVSLAAAVLIYGAFVLVSWNMRSAGIGGDGGAEVPLSFAHEQSNDLPNRASPDARRKPSSKSVIARIRSVRNCVWEAGARVFAEGQTLDAEELRIAAGVVEIAFEHGATVELYGPTQFTLESTEHGALHHGSLMARVPERAIGFSIATPAGNVVDLGTEFGLQVERSTGHTQVEVFRGQVRVDASPSGPSLTNAPITLQQGQGLKLARDEKGNFAAIPVVVMGEQPTWQKPRRLHDPNLWAYEPFAFDAAGEKASLIGRTGGLGFVSPWLAAGRARATRPLTIAVQKSPVIPGYPSNVPFQPSEGVFAGSAGQLTSVRRSLRDVINLAADAEYYLSFVAQKSANNTSCLVDLWARNSEHAIRAGWEASQSTAADPFVLYDLEDGVRRVRNPRQRFDRTEEGANPKTIFAVLRIIARSKKPDLVYFKVYSSANESVHPHPGLLRGEGSGRDQWTLIAAPFKSSLELDRLGISHVGAEGSVFVDDIRIGSTWQAVTGVKRQDAPGNSR